MIKQFRLCCALACILLLSAASIAVSQSTSADDGAVRKVLSGLSAADNAGDLNAILSHYSDEAILLPPDGPPLVGQPGVRSFYEPALSRFRFEVSFDADETQVSGDWAFARGFINGRLVPKGEGTPVKLREKYIMVLRRQNGGWKIARLIWNASEPRPRAAT